MPHLSLFPRWRTNPYLTMLTPEVRARGWTVGGVVEHDELLTELRRLTAGDVLHLHWTATLTGGVRDAAHLDERVTALDAALDEAARRGVRLWWTVHNTVTHDAKYPAQEVRLARVLADRAERVLVLASRTEQAVAPHYTLPPEKVRRLPHASYLGVYPPRLDRDEARRRLGIPTGDHVLGTVGGLRPYKGLRDLLAAAGELGRTDPRAALLLAGTTYPDAMAIVERDLPRHVPAHRRHGVLSDDELVTWTSACDVLVLPYTDILNSGTLMLAATLGVPVVLPDLPHLVADHGDEAWIEWFDHAAASRPGAVADAVRRSLAAPRAPRVAAALARAAAYPPRRMSIEYADLLQST